MQRLSHGSRSRDCRGWIVCAFLGIELLLCGPPNEAPAQQASASDTGCVALGLFVRNECDNCDAIREQVEALTASLPGVQLRQFNLDEPGPHVERYEQILKYFSVPEAKAPVLYGCNYLLMNLEPGERLESRVKKLFTVDVYVREGCPRCAAAKQFLARIKPRYPSFQFNIYDIVSDASARDRVQTLGQRYGAQAVSVPVFHFCNQLVVGWSGEGITGHEFESKLKYWTTSCSKPGSRDGGQQTSSTSTSSLERRRGDEHANSAAHVAGLRKLELLFLSGYFSALADDAPSTTNAAAAPTDKALPLPVPARAPPDEGSSDLPPLPAGDPLGPPPPIPSDDSLGPPPPPGGEPDTGEEPQPALPRSQTSETVTVPILGELSLRRLGMPAFTVLIGLVDGFNPCAMWVLMFLLSVLVNLKSRVKILAVAGTFVLVSGLAYFAFMAAWLSVFLFVGYLRAAQVTLGMLAMVVGAIHVKDFFAFKQGVSLSIPESAKPGIYARVRRIVMAENLAGAVLGASVLAVLINVIELLCTAGLPALYTGVLTMQEYPRWMNYAYLALYNVAYMFDDSLMVGIVVITLGRRKLQESEGRWLKLVSGVFVLGLGAVMLLRPDLLEMFSVAE